MNNLKLARNIAETLISITDSDLSTVKTYIDIIKSYLDNGMNDATLESAVTQFQVMLTAANETLEDNILNFDKIISDLTDGDDDIMIELESSEFRLINAEEIDEIHIQSLIDLLQETHHNVDESILVIDWEQSAKNAAIDGYGHHFSHYDGSEEYAEGYYIFRTN